MVWGDANCDGVFNAIDSLLALLNHASLHKTHVGCPRAGQTVFIDGVPYVWGDIDCSGDAGPLDTLEWLRRVAGFARATPIPDCPEEGETVVVTF